MGQIISIIAAIITIAWFVSEAMTGTNPTLIWILRILVGCALLFLCYFIYAQGKLLKALKGLKPILKISEPLPQKPGELLKGKAWVANPGSYAIAAYLCVNGGWWNKPLNEKPKTLIFADGEWSCEIFSDKVWVTDKLATKVKVFLLDRNVEPPLMNGQMAFSDSFNQQAIDTDEVDLSPDNTVAY